MMLNGDRFFVEELQKQGYDIDYKKLVAIYKDSRQSDGYKNRKAKQKREMHLLAKYEDELMESMNKKDEK